MPSEGLLAGNGGLLSLQVQGARKASWHAAAYGEEDEKQRSSAIIWCYGVNTFRPHTCYQNVSSIKINLLRRAKLDQ